MSTFGIRSASVATLLLVACAAPILDEEEEAVAAPLEVVLERAVHFNTPEGEQRELAAGAYAVEASEAALRLTPSQGSAIAVVASPIAHDEEIAESIALASVEGEDELHLLLLHPDGNGMDAVGSFSGFASRADRPVLGKQRISLTLSRARASGRMMRRPATAVPLAPATGQAQPAGASLQRLPVTADAGLSRLGAQREAALESALESTQGRITRAEWEARVGDVGKLDPAYKAARTHMPRGMGFAVEIESPGGAAAARRAASEHALEQAASALRRAGMKRVAPGDAQQLIARRDEEVRRLNSRLASESLRLREASQRGGPDEVARLTGDLLRQYAEQPAGKTAPEAQPGLSRAGHINMTREHYYAFMNRVPTADAGGRVK